MAASGAASPVAHHWRSLTILRAPTIPSLQVSEEVRVATLEIDWQNCLARSSLYRTLTLGTLRQRIPFVGRELMSQRLESLP